MQKGEGMKIGNDKCLHNSIDVAFTYQKLAEDNRKSADLLFNHSLYNEAAYFYIQTMEKIIKEEICKIVDVTNPYFSDKLRNIGHSLDLSVSFLIEILSGNNELLKNQLTAQLVKAY
jgi:HEPN domain-containing protein